MEESETQELFRQLKALMAPYATHLNLIKDDTRTYHLDTFHIMKNKKPMFFGSVNIGKNYLSYHLMPVYVKPKLLDAISPPLKKRMQGKSCFNFKATDTDLFSELATLTRAGYEFYVDEGYVTEQQS